VRPAFAAVIVGINVWVRVGVSVGVLVEVEDGRKVHVGRGVNVIVLVLDGVRLGELVNEAMRVIFRLVGLGAGFRA
jgi:hypothetical protein